LFDELARIAGVAVICSPSVSQGADATILAGCSDGVLLVLRAGRSREAAVRRTTDLLHQLDVPIFRVLLLERGFGGDLSSRNAERVSTHPRGVDTISLREARRDDRSSHTLASDGGAGDPSHGADLTNIDGSQLPGHGHRTGDPSAPAERKRRQ
jgi:hypothetical protein